MPTIKIIVGLGNPGSEYEHTRHNAGVWLVANLAQQNSVKLQHELKLKAVTAAIKMGEQNCRLLIPTTYMNLSGQAVQAAAKFYKITPEEILVVHDDLDLAPGMVRLKKGGGHGGHNGLRDIITNLHSNEFWRIRLGIGHPGDRDQVVNFVLKSPSKQEKIAIEDAIHEALRVLPKILAGDYQAAMKELHTPSA